MKIPEELIKKYNTAIPRYTSYPPATYFHERFSAGDYIEMVAASNRAEPRNIAFYIHIPFCKRICFYCGCNSCPAGKGELILPYMKKLAREIRMVSEHLDKDRLVSQIHYGGGTPNSISIDLIREINELLFREHRFIDNPEIAIECNPEFLTFDQVDRLADAGFNRISVGIQDFNEKILGIVNRAPSILPPGELFPYLKNRKFGVNFDFIYGLPGQTVDSFSETITKAVKIRPDRLVTFSYAHVPWMKKHQLVLEKAGLPAPEDKMDMFLASREKLTGAGYMPLGLDHFVLPDDDLYTAYRSKQLHRNFQGYTTRRTTGQVYAFGVSAISQLEMGYSQNTKDIRTYMNIVDNGRLPVEKGYVLSGAQKIIREVINSVMCNKKLSFSRIAGEMNITVTDVKEATGFREERLSDLVADGIIIYSGDEIEVTEKGTLFMRNVAVLFDRDYHEKDQTYSRTV